jgi:ATP synthase protein I
MFPVATAMGGAFGYWLDKKLGTFPWLSILFLFFGIAAAFVNLLRTVRLFDRPGGS